MSTIRMKYFEVDLDESTNNHLEKNKIQEVIDNYSVKFKSEADEIKKYRLQRVIEALQEVIEYIDKIEEGVR